MARTLILASWLVVGVLSAASAAAPSFRDIFMQVDGIKGGSTAAGHQGWIEVQSCSWGDKQFGTIADRGGPGSVVLTKAYDVASPQLLKACCQGEHIRQAILTCTRLAGPDGAPTGEPQVLHITLRNVVIASFLVTNNGRVVETITLSWETHEIKV